MSANAVDLVMSAKAVDLGTSNFKSGVAWITPDNQVEFSSNQWDMVRPGMIDIEGLGRFYCWHGEILNYNLELALKNMSDPDKIKVIAGAYAQPIAVSNEHGDIIAVFHNKPALRAPVKSATDEQLKNLGIDLAEIEETRPIQKLHAFPEYWEPISRALNLPNYPFEDLFFESLLSAVARKALGDKSKMGFSPDEWKGITNDDKLTYDQTVYLGNKIMEILNIGPHQYGWQETRMVRKPDGRVAYIAGDYQMTGWTVEQMVNEGRFDPQNTMFVEMDSTKKETFFGKDPEIIEDFPTPNHFGRYRKNIGAIVHSALLFPMWANEFPAECKDPYLFIDQQIEEAVDRLNQNQYFYFPISSYNNPNGILTDINGNPIDWNKQVFEDLAAKQVKTCAIYAGLGAMLNHNLHNRISNVVLYGGYMNDQQPHKRRALVGCFNSRVNASWLQLPDNGNAGILASVKAFQELGYPVGISQKCRVEPLSHCGDFSQYYERWKRVYKKLLI